MPAAGDSASGIEGRRSRPPARRLLPPIVAAAALLFMAMYFFTAIPRVFYPYDLDFVEDSMLLQSLRFAQGLPVYIAPSAEFVPHVYMPLYPWLGGLLFRIAGPGYAPLRLLSLAATVTTAGLLYLIARRECPPGFLARPGWVGLACAGLYLGGYRLSGFWYELARVDSLFTALALGGAALAIYGGGSARRLALSAAVLALAFHAKQTGLLLGAGLAFYLLLALGRRAAVFAVTFGVLALAPVAALNATTGGWFLYHTLRVASGDPVQIERVFRFVGLELFGAMAGVSVMAGAAALLAARRARRGLYLIRERPWLFVTAMAVVISGVGRASVGGNLNNLMPAYALLCLAPALLMRELAGAPSQVPQRASGTRPDAERPAGSTRGAALVLAAILLQFALGVYNPFRYIPSPAMRQSGDRLVRRIASIDGPVLVMMHPYYAWLAGKEPSAQIATIWYIHAWQGAPLPQDFVDRIRGQHYAAIISDESLFETDPDIRALIAAHYPWAEPLAAAESPPTLTGLIVRPMALYRPSPPGSR